MFNYETSIYIYIYFFFNFKVKLTIHIFKFLEKIDFGLIDVI